MAVIVSSLISASAGADVVGGAGIGGSPTVTGGVSPFSYVWNPAGNLSSATVANPTALCSGSNTTYTVTTTDANGCTADDNVLVTRNLSADAGADVTGCNIAIGGAPTATGGAGGYTYSWSPGSGLSSTTVANPVASGSTQTFIVTVTDANGCAKSDTMVFTSACCTGGSITFNYTGGVQNFLVPAGCTTVTVDIRGSQGGDAVGNAIGWNNGPVNISGGNGGKVQGTLAVTGGETLKIYVGGQGSTSIGGFNGGGAPASCSGTEVIAAGGGGASDIRRGGTALSNRIVVAGGGGGSSGSANTAYQGTGGAGGDLTGANGTTALGLTCLPGSGGTQSNGGSAGNSSCFCGGSCTANIGSLGMGGASVCCASGLSTCSCNGTGCVSGGGGGGGYYGGGASIIHGGGGGGSSNTGSVTGVTHTQGVQTGNGQVIISW